MRSSVVVRQWTRRSLIVAVGLASAASVGAAVSFGRLQHADPAFRLDVTRHPATRLAQVEPAARWRWVQRGRLPGPEGAACDLASTPAGLVIAASVDPLTEDGAALYRLEDDGLEMLLRWPGQGFTRVQAFGDRLIVPDADAPFSWLSFAFTWEVDGYLFVSDERGRFLEESRETLPGAYHVFDAAQLNDGRLVASAGGYRPGDAAYLSKQAPAVLFADDGPDRPWRRLVEYPDPLAHGVNRFTYLQALEDGSLLAAVQTSRSDLPAAVRFPAGTDGIHAEEVAGLDGLTLRWSTWHDAVFHIAQVGSQTRLSRSIDGGRSFEELRTGTVQALAPTKERLFLLENGTLFVSLDGLRFEQVSAPEPALAHTPSPLVSAPLVVHRGHLWAASPTTGEIFEAVPAEEVTDTN